MPTPVERLVIHRYERIVSLARWVNILAAPMFVLGVVLSCASAISRNSTVSRLDQYQANLGILRVTEIVTVLRDIALEAAYAAFLVVLARLATMYADRYLIAAESLTDEQIVATMIANASAKERAAIEH